VTGVSAKVPDVVIAGSKRAKGKLAVTVRNDGGSDYKGVANVAILASSDAIADSADVALGQSSKKMNLQAGRSKVVKLRASLEALPQGGYTLIGVATVNNLSSSKAGPSLSVEAPRVHLVEGAVPPSPGKPIPIGGKGTLRVPLMNAGNVATTKTPATFTLVVSPVGSQTPIYQTTATAPLKLKPGASRPQKVNVVIPAGALAAGSYTVSVKVDAALNDTNGQVVTALPVTLV
jgi:hypothetical protein